MRIHLRFAFVAYLFVFLLWPGAASALLPAKQPYIAIANNPHLCTGGGQITAGACDYYASLSEACNVLMSAVNSSSHPCGYGGLVKCYEAQGPNFDNNVWAHYSVDQQLPYACSSGDFVIGSAVHSGAASCPSNSTPSGAGCACNAGFTEDQSSGTCVAGKNAACGGGNAQAANTVIGNPCNAATGNKYERQPVYSGANGFELWLAFNTDDENITRFGHRWRDSFDRRIVQSGTAILAYRPGGSAFQFLASGGAWVGDADTNERLTELLDQTGTRTGWQLLTSADELESYDASGNVLSIASRNGLVQTFAYSDGTATGPNGDVLLDPAGVPTVNPVPAGRLLRATDAFGRTLKFTYDLYAHVVIVTDPAGGMYRFAYDAMGNLASITFPDGSARSYAYNEAANTGGANLPNALTGIIDENGARYATFTYNAQERALSTEHAGGAQRFTFSYASGSTTVTDALGVARGYGYQAVLGAFKNTGITGQPCPSCGAAAQSFDANGNPGSRTDWNGNVTTYTFDAARNLETSRTEASGTPQARTISTQWHPVFRLRARVAEPLRITTYVYNGDGGAQCGFMADGTTLVPGVLCSKTVQATTDASGAAGFGATVTGAPRTWTYTYNANGSVLTIDGPRTDVADVTTYTYFANNDADPGWRGNISTVTNALGQTTSITAYDANGAPTSITDPNGLVTTLAYDARRRLVSRNVGGEITSYSYDSVGQLTRVTLPDASYLQYTYDAAHRLTGISDSLGNRIAYTLDAMGNRTQEQVFDPANALAQTRSRVFDSLNRLAQEIGAQNQTTAYAYDNQGNVTSVTDPLNHVTANQYDALNRLVQVTDPGLAVTRYGYNGESQLTSVTDPRNLATTYAYDGLSNLNQQVSPDTGTTTSTYDAAGNLLTQTDAKGQVTAYAYDALNRVASITFNDGSKQTYAYDQGPNGIGRLSRITELDPAQAVTGKIAYGYDAHGRVVSEVRTIAGLDYVTTYSYDAAGRLTGMMYPSGRTVAYALDSLGRIQQISTAPPAGSAQTIASSVAYQPFGGVKSYALANGQQATRGFDLDGRISSYNLLDKTYAIGYDAASRISFIADAANPSIVNNYGYDALDRLTSAAIPNNQYAYAYDAVGNRMSKTVGASTDTYAYSTTSNRIASITAQAGGVRNFVFDPNGSTTDDGVNQYVYDARGRMVQSVGALGTTTYQVNALGQRVRKTNSSDDRIFHYDAKGHLIAESDPGGAVKREYIWLGDIPVAVMQ